VAKISERAYRVIPLAARLPPFWEARGFPYPPCEGVGFVGVYMFMSMINEVGNGILNVVRKPLC